MSEDRPRSIDRVKNEAHSLMGQYHQRVIIVVLVQSMMFALLPFLLLFATSSFLTFFFDIHSCVPHTWAATSLECCLSTSVQLACGVLFLVFVSLVSFWSTRFNNIRRFQRSALYMACIIVYLCFFWFLTPSLALGHVLLLGVCSFFASFWGYRLGISKKVI